ncbi:STAS domain-containing protein [Streptomyces mirabilis]|uniref:STAS domain-containing protein n=1 Tax=Streptomyces mirabilis TaxID=68239 RepID=A0A1I2MLM4_9ACTN|nr:hypothetical protein [Streptomyces mirabilis]SFF90031.1 hypothetical protein SAMN02787118_113117 [Streptomyces mirabilis]
MPESGNLTAGSTRASECSNRPARAAATAIFAQAKGQAGREARSAVGHPLTRSLRRAAEVVPHPDHGAVRLSGETTSENADRIGEDLREVLPTRPPILEIDLTGVTYRSSDGCKAVFMALLAARHS